ncbi:hypothetical protein [Streptococcus uberis]|uniref:hypothetical protein n=1 Tax=Streptococcus uberis TaxID=1349 RepID=UPI00062045D7|nr:hypothetical protein [Streptococcus uberis]KKF54878.1 TcdA-E operon negative regulator [Streptococcus uberis 6780]QBX11903.1 hypothetical protein JavanS619_0003 [Streptococcus satellite phage Javan619]
MGMFLATVGILGFPVALLVWLYSMFKKNNDLKNKSLIAMGITFALFVIGLVIYKPEEEIKTTEPKQEKAAQTKKTTESSSTKKEDKKEIVSSSSTEQETKTSEETVTSSSETPFNPADFATVDYNEWNHDKVEIGSKVQITGEVIQAQQSDGDMTLRVKINDDYDQIVLVSVVSEIYKDIIAENDNVTFYGINAGLTSYKTVMGNEKTLPLLMTTKYTVNSYGQ